MATNHKTSFILFCNYLEQDIDAPLCKELLQHIEECPDCRHNLETIKKTIQLYREGQPKAKLTPEMKKRLLEKLRSSMQNGKTAI